MFTQRAYVDAYGYEKLGLEFPGWNCFLVFYLFCTNKKGTKEEGKIGMYFENERISLEKKSINSHWIAGR